MTLEEIRGLADSILGGGRDNGSQYAAEADRRDLAVFAIAVLDALDEAGRRAAIALNRSDYHYYGAVKAIRRDITERLE